MPGSEERVKEVQEITLGGVVLPDRRDPASAQRRQVEVAPDGGLRVMVRSGGWRELASQQITASAVVLGGVMQKGYPEARVEVCNTDTAAMYYLNLYLLANGAAVADARALVKGWGIMPGGHYVRETALGEGDAIYVQADTTLKLTAKLLVKDEG